MATVAIDRGLSAHARVLCMCTHVTGSEGMNSLLDECQQNRSRFYVQDEREVRGGAGRGEEGSEGSGEEDTPPETESRRV